MCPQECSTNFCSKDGSCCHRLCLGGCTGPSDRECMACRKAIYKNQCIDKCPKDTYEFDNRFCLTETECRNRKKIKHDSRSTRDYPYKPFQDKCIIECPAGYEEISVIIKLLKF